jgi:predicted DNA-binding protein
MVKERPIVWKQLPLRIEDTMYDRLDELSQETLISKSALVRAAIKKFFAEVEKTSLKKTISNLTN